MNFDIDKITTKLLIKYPGFATIIANMEYIPSYDCKSNGNPTAACDGKNFIYHPEFMNNISEDEQLFIVAHEVLHIAFDHIYRSEGKDPKIWNIASDAVSNAFLKKSGLKMVDGGVDIEGAENYDVETLYNKLLEQRKNNNSNSDNNNSNQNNSDSSNDMNKNDSDNNNSQDSNNVGHDSHSMWKEAVKKHKEELKQGNENKEIEQLQKNNSKLGEKETFKKNEELKKENLKKLKRDLIKKSAGNTTNSGSFKLDNIGESSLINWQTLLKNTAKINIDWSYQNATIEYGVVTPHLEMLPNPETEILLDTSESVSDELLKNFLRECKGILNTSRIKVGCFDTKFYGFTEIKRESDIDNMTFQGRGGTDFDVAINSFTKRVDNRVIFTDGDSTMPQKALDVIWIVFGGKKIKPSGGKVIYISEEDLDKLNGINSKSK